MIGRLAGQGKALGEAAEEIGMPLVTHAFAAGPVAETVREAYGASYVLGRPDGYLAWRSETPGWVSDPMDSRLSSWDSGRRSESLRTLGGTLDGEREARGDMHDGGQLSGGSSTLGPAVGPSTDIITVSVRGVFTLRGAPICHIASAPRPGANLGSGIPGQGESIVRRLMRC